MGACPLASSKMEMRSMLLVSLIPLGLMVTFYAEAALAMAAANVFSHDLGLHSARFA